MVSCIFKLGFWTHPNWCLDQLDTVLARGVALFLLPINQHVIWSEFSSSLQSIILDMISITRI